MRATAVALVSLLLAAGTGHAQAVPKWSVATDESEIGFGALQGGAAIDGSFARFEADLRFDPTQLDMSRFRVEIDVASLDSGNSDRDNTLRSNAFFDVAVWPLAKFESSDVRAVGEGRFEAHGDLTIRDRRLPVVLPFALELGGTPGERRARANGELTINRMDYGVGQGQWADTSVIADPVRITVRVVASELER